MASVLPPSSAHPYANSHRSQPSTHQAKSSSSSSSQLPFTQQHSRSSSLAQTSTAPFMQHSTAMSMSGVAAALPQQPQPVASTSRSQQQPPQGSNPPQQQRGAKTAGEEKKEEPRRVRFSVGAKYQVQDVIGEGAYGVVACVRWFPLSRVPSLD